MLIWDGLLTFFKDVSKVLAESFVLRGSFQLNFLKKLLVSAVMFFTVLISLRLIMRMNQ